MAAQVNPNIRSLFFEKEAYGSTECGHRVLLSLFEDCSKKVPCPECGTELKLSWDVYSPANAILCLFMPPRGA